MERKLFIIMLLSLMAMGAIDSKAQDFRHKHEPRDQIMFCLSDEKFTILYNKVKKASFDDNKFDLIEVASLGCYYSCAQVVRIMKVFPFDDEQLKALKMMAPHIVDLQNTGLIYKIFSFDSEKDKAE